MMTEFSVRYIVDNVDAAVDFYTRHLQFEVLMKPGPGFAMLRRNDLRLLLNTPGGGGGAGQTLSDGSTPEPGGWNRVVLQVASLPARIEALKKRGLKFRNEMESGPAGSQIQLEDPDGNPIELFEPAR